MNIVLFTTIQLFAFALLMLKISRQSRVRFIGRAGIFCVSMFLLMSLLSVENVRLSLDGASPYLSLFLTNCAMVLAFSSALVDAFYARVKRPIVVTMMSALFAGIILSIMTWLYRTELVFLPPQGDWSAFQRPWPTTHASLLFTALVLGYAVAAGTVLSIHYWRQLHSELNYLVRVRHRATFISAASMTAMLVTLVIKTFFSAAALRSPPILLVFVQLFSLTTIATFSIHLLPPLLSRPVTRWLIVIVQWWDLWRLQPLLDFLEAESAATQLLRPLPAYGVPVYEQLCKASIYILDAKTLLARSRDPHVQQIIAQLDADVGSGGIEAGRIAEIVHYSIRVSRDIKSRVVPGTKDISDRRARSL